LAPYDFERRGPRDYDVINHIYVRVYIQFEIQRPHDPDFNYKLGLDGIAPGFRRTDFYAILKVYLEINRLTQKSR
jgi:hypothetical protein